MLNRREEQTLSSLLSLMKWTPIISKGKSLLAKYKVDKEYLNKKLICIEEFYSMNQKYGRPVLVWCHAMALFIG